MNQQHDTLQELRRNFTTAGALFALILIGAWIVTMVL
jgi:hypothetical protein